MLARNFFCNAAVGMKSGFLEVPGNNTGGTCLGTARRAPTLINNQLNENTL